MTPTFYPNKKYIYDKVPSTWYFWDWKSYFPRFSEVATLLQGLRGERIWMSNSDECSCSPLWVNTSNAKKALNFRMSHFSYLPRFVTKKCDVTNYIGSKLLYENNGLVRANEQYYNIRALSMIACFASSEKFLLMAHMGKKVVQ